MIEIKDVCLSKECTLQFMLEMARVVENKNINCMLNTEGK